MKISQISFSAAAIYCNSFHSHLKAPRGYKFALALTEKNTTHAIVICGRPVNRNFDSDVIEVTRVISITRKKNSCSMLLAAARRLAKAKGFKKIISYTRADEQGTIYKADNWKQVAKIKGRQWHGRKKHEIIDKYRWEMNLIKDSNI